MDNTTAILIGNNHMAYCLSRINEYSFKLVTKFTMKYG